MAGAKLRYTVTVQDEKGDQHSFGPTDTVPAWAQKLITNPKAWDEDAPADDADVDPDAIPPLSGKGSGVKAWEAYAAAKDVEVPTGATRDEIVAALNDAGVPTEPAPGD